MDTAKNNQRNIKKVWSVQGTQVSSIHYAAPILKPGLWADFDPFLLMMDDTFKKGAFDIHPHRGMETVTYVIDGSITHYDSASGEGGTLRQGDLQFMTAGRGVVHNETPTDGETVHLLQLWVNLPRVNKMTSPRYQNLQAKDVPVRKEDGALIRVYSGSSGDIVSSTLNYAPVTFVEMVIDSGKAVSQELPGSYNGFIYILEGSGMFGLNKVEAAKGQALWIDSAPANDLSSITVAANEKLRLILFAGEPLREPVVARGPFVMNTEDEIIQAYEDYRNGLFYQDKLS